MSEPEQARLFIQRGLSEGLFQQLPVKAEGPRLLRGQRTAELAAKLLQLVGVKLAELVYRNLGVTDGRQRRLTIAPEDIGNAPVTKTDNQRAHGQGHDRFAEPIG